jgi:hypothetical protein
MVCSYGQRVRNRLQSLSGVSRRNLLAAGVSGVVGLGLGLAGGYFLSPEKQVTRTVEITRQVGGTTVTQPVTTTITQTVVYTPTRREVTLKISASPTGIIPYLVASREGFDREYGVKIEPVRVGYEVEADLFQAGKEPVGDAAPWEAARIV